MPIRELVKGNRLEDIQDENAKPIGYRIHTGPPGTETSDASYCGDSRVLEYKIADHADLRKHQQGVCNSNWDWPAWLLTCKCEMHEGSGTTAQLKGCCPTSEVRKPGSG